MTFDSLVRQIYSCQYNIMIYEKKWNNIMEKNKPKLQCKMLNWKIQIIPTYKD